MTLNKLPAIRGDLVRTDSQWKEWDFGKLVEALKGWVERNPVDTSKTPDDGNRKRDRSGKVFQTQQTRGQQRSRICVYCGSNDHKSSNCSVTKTPSEWKQVLVKKRLCFNCTGSSHRATECKSTATCQVCAKRHHTSICESPKESRPEGFMIAQRLEENKVIYPVVQINVDGIRTRALLDTGAGSSYASAKLIEALRKKPKEGKTKQIEMMLGLTTMKIEIHSANVQSIDNEFSMNADLSKVHKVKLMNIDNPRYEEYSVNTLI